MGSAIKEFFLRSRFAAWEKIMGKAWVCVAGWASNNQKAPQISEEKTGPDFGCLLKSLDKYIDRFYSIFPRRDQASEKSGTGAKIKEIVKKLKNPLAKSTLDRERLRKNFGGIRGLQNLPGTARHFTKNGSGNQTSWVSSGTFKNFSTVRGLRGASKGTLRSLP